ncbi:PI-PLC X domain-containing protein [Panicum miliaceum]|uniref:PI-PLC X domain-containing protein n=1 Tax=Panicum miliaceum TaxID=4540 RepID=A0A3L6T4K0_PANMI|nr:PI-PLC X domain-containing protein [Panicum miliaceum]
MREVEAFLSSSNPSGIVTLILEDGARPAEAVPGRRPGELPVPRVADAAARRGLTAGPRDMVARGHRLLVFTSARWKQTAEGIAYQWDYMVENQCKEEDSEAEP